MGTYCVLLMIWVMIWLIPIGVPNLIVNLIYEFARKILKFNSVSVTSCYCLFINLGQSFEFLAHKNLFLISMIRIYSLNRSKNCLYFCFLNEIEIIVLLLVIILKPCFIIIFHLHLLFMYLLL